MKKETDSALKMIDIVWENSQRLKVVYPFSQKSSIIDVWHNPTFIPLRYSHANCKNTDKWSHAYFKSIAKISHSNYL